MITVIWTPAAVFGALHEKKIEKRLLAFFDGKSHWFHWFEAVWWALLITAGCCLKHVILGGIGKNILLCTVCQLKICQVVHEERQERLQTKPPKSFFSYFFVMCHVSMQTRRLVFSKVHGTTIGCTGNMRALHFSPYCSFQRRPPKIHHETETWHLFPTCQVSVSRL